MRTHTHIYIYRFIFAHIFGLGVLCIHGLESYVEDSVVSGWRLQGVMVQ